MNKLEFLEKVKNVEISYNLENTYNELYDLWMDYLCDTNDYSFEYIFNEFCSYDLVEDIAKNELENGGLIRLYYFLGSADLTRDVFKIDGYGNLKNIDKSDLEYIKQEIIYNLEKDLKP